MTQLLNEIKVEFIIIWVPVVVFVVSGFYTFRIYLEEKKTTMERKTNFCSCRLTAHHESGRIRWCVGREREWQTKLKRLVFVPIILLPIMIFVVFLTKYAATTTITTTTTSNNHSQNIISLRKYDENEILGDEDKRDVLQDLQTSYQSDFVVNHTKISKNRRKREIIWNIQNFSDYEDNVYNESYEYSINYGKFTLDWKMLPDTRKSIDTTTNKSKFNEILFWKNKFDYQQIRILQAKTMKKYMNESMDPCEDFYKFACGNWLKYHKIPADRTSYDTFEMLRENLDFALRDIFSETTEMENSILSNLTTNSDLNNLDAVIKAKFFYKSCMNEEKLKELGEQPLLELLEDLGGWPMLNNQWDETKFDLETLMGQLKLYNNDILITEWIGPDIINSKYYMIQIDQTTLGLPGRGYFFDPTYRKYLKAYKQFIITVAGLLGASYQDAESDTIDLIEFETKLARIMIPSENRRNVTDLYFRTTVGKLSNYIPQFDWAKYFSIVIGREIDLDEEIACYCMDYLYKFVNVLQQTKPRTIANYLLWRFIKHRTNNLDERFLNAKQRFYRTLFGREQSPPRWQFCVSQINSNMGMAVGNLFIKKYFDENSKNDTLDITKRLQTAFRMILNENEWLGNQTKNYAHKKIDKMNLKIGYPDFLLNNSELTARYYDVKIHPEDFFKNTLNILRYLTKIEQQKLGKQVNKTVWGTAPAVVNAYYSRNKNQIIFPAGILQPPFYHQYFPKSLNFGGIGVVIGHEITHGFDDKGRLFDEDGNLQHWWNDDSIRKFHQRAKCMIDQYNSYIIPDVATNIDGFITQGENIADNGGLKQAFRAYEMWLKNNPNADETLPGLNYTGKQLFFLNFAQVWCGKQRIDTLKSRLKVAVHSPGMFRVIGTLSNSEDFSKVFNCPKDSPMNPSEKCSLW